MLPPIGPGNRAEYVLTVNKALRRIQIFSSKENIDSICRGGD
jgi:hypothetical protein